VQGLLNAGTVVGELGDQALLVLLPRGGHTELEVGEHQRVEAVGVELGEAHPVAHAERPVDVAEQPTGTQLAHVVDTHVELEPVVAVVAPEHLGVAARHIVGLQHEHLLAGAPETRRSTQPSGPGTDDDGIPLFD